MGLFIVFEGGEGCGKSTQAKALWQRLQQANFPALLTHEPGGTLLGKEIRHCLKKKWLNNPSAVTEFLLFTASRAQLVTEVIRPNLDKGRIVICDRFTDSSLAYQGYGRGIELTTIDAINTLATGGLRPDLVILLDLHAETGLTRRRVKRLDRFEQEKLDFHQRVRDGYLKLAAREPERWLIIDAALPKAKIGKTIWERVSQLLSNKGYL